MTVAAGKTSRTPPWTKLAPRFAAPMPELVYAVPLSSAARSFASSGVAVSVVKELAHAPAQAMTDRPVESLMPFVTTTE